MSRIIRIIAYALTVLAIFPICRYDSASPQFRYATEKTFSVVGNDISVQADVIAGESMIPCETLPEEPKIETVTISFIGDCMLASFKGRYMKNNFNTLADKKDPSFFFSGVYEILSSDDFTVANCENVFTDEELTPVEKGYTPAYWYRSKKKNARIFAEGSVEAVSVANNHTGDYGKKGANDTKSALDEAGVIWGDSTKPVIFEKYGVKIAVYMTNMWAKYRADEIGKKIKQLEKESDYQIVYYHGGTERKYVPDAWRVKASKRLIDLGAEAVIGNHPHVIQPMETYKGHDIVYSLGNFIAGGAEKDDKFTIIYQKILYIEDGKIVDEGNKIIPVYEYKGKKITTWCPYPMEENSEDWNNVIRYMNGEAKTPRG